MTLLELRGVKVTIAGERAAPVHPLQGVDLRVGAGQTVGLVGESGSGKSMTIRAALRLLPAGGLVTAGQITWKERSVLDMDRAALQRYRGADVAMIFQDPVAALDPMLTVERQIVGAYRANQPGSDADARAAAQDALRRLDITRPERVLRLYPHQLSGGMAQRVNIAMALVCGPELLLADEPTTGLDVTTQLQVLDLLQERVHSERAALLFISHDLRVVSRICAYVGVMYAGAVVEFGPRDQILNDPVHPYTRALLACASIDGDGVPRFIPGQVPTLDVEHELCPYRDRCDARLDVCSRQPPPIRTASTDHAARCHLEVTSRV